MEMLVKLETIYSLTAPLPPDVGTKLECFGAIRHQFQKEFCSQKVISQDLASLRYSHAQLGIFGKCEMILFQKSNIKLCRWKVCFLSDIDKA
jgi:hypothetical protein